MTHRAWRRAALQVAMLTLGAACSVERAPELGAPCEDDGDCAAGYFCGADPGAPDDEPVRMCVPEADCDAGRFEVHCAGRGYYACIDNQVTWTECASGCDDGACLGE